ncbi:MAG: hypothetical protein SNJ70_08095, partial [Armatimonadota bacterium]
MRFPLLFVSIVIFVLFSSSCFSAVSIECSHPENTPTGFGVKDLKNADFSSVKDNITIKVFVKGDNLQNQYKSLISILPDKAESFVISRYGYDIVILGSDHSGAMYGCFEWIERFKIDGNKAFDIKTPIIQTPQIEFRAVNPFLTLPYKESEEDWWFLNEKYWEGYLNLLARSRFNWIDLHGMYDIKTTKFPNMYPYFIISEKYPEVGVEPQKAKRNLDMLNKAIRMAKERGIKFAIMSYSTNFEGPFLRKHSYNLDEATVAEYTKEVVRKTIEQCPELDMIGFRIGESGRSGDFFRMSYVPAIKEAGREIDLYTRTWLTEKEPVLGIGEDFPGRFFVEIKYNGEQFGPPYIVSGGITLNRHSYFYQDYYSYPKNYKIIYQIRTNGSHRVFYWGNPIIASRANLCGTLGGAIGSCIEPIHSYYPNYNFRQKDDSPNRWFDWQFERDWYFYTVWGRTAYNPALAYKDDVWVNMFAQRFGSKASKDVYLAMKYASKIIPDALTAYLIHPDHRNHAPELETSGNVFHWSGNMPFDIQNVQLHEEWAERILSGKPSARVSPIKMADYLADSVRLTKHYVAEAKRKNPNPNPEFNDLMTELTALAHLGDYYQHKLRAASLLALLIKSGDIEGNNYGGEKLIREELKLAHNAWNELAKIGDEYYKPFVDTLRMYTEEFTWSEEGKKLAEDFEALDKSVEEAKAGGLKQIVPSIAVIGDGKGPKLFDISSNLEKMNESVKRLHVKVKAEDKAGIKSVLLKWKPLPSERLWSTKPMVLKDGYYSAYIDVYPDGLQWGIEALDNQNNGTLFPDFRREDPYKIVEAWNAPMPFTEPAEALKTLPNVDMSKYSAIVAGRRAEALNLADK